MLRHFVTLLAAILLFSVISAPHVNLSYAETATQTRVYGHVFDFETKQPLPRALVGWFIEDHQEIVGETNGTGFFETYVESFEEYTFFAYYDDNSTPGVDYVPALREVTPQGDPTYISFSLLAGASINATEDPLFSFEESYFSCVVVDENGLLELTNSVATFGGERTGPDWIYIYVPANTGVRIELNVYRRFETASTWRPWRLVPTASLMIPTDGGFLNLKQGEQVTLNLRNVRLDFEADTGIPGRLDHARSLAEEIGVLSSYERVRISSAEELLTRARESISEGDYVSVQADLHESYLVLEDVERALLSLFQNSVLSLYFITPFMAVTSSALGAIFFRDRLKRIVSSTAFYGFFIIILYLAYPGYSFVQNPAYNPLAGTFLESYILPLLLVPSLLLGLFLINGPYTYGEMTDRSGLSLRSAIVTAFSLAVDNLKRRKLRTFLTMIFMLISVFAFIITTSYSYEEGFVIEQKKGTAPSEGIFLFQQAVNRRVLPFGPVDEEIIQWLSERETVALTVPLLKNIPQIGTPPQPLGMLSNADSSLDFSVLGVLGVKPSLEVPLTKISQVVGQGEGTGRFLSDTDLDGILISREAEEALQVSLNDKIRFCERDFTVIGIFDSGRLGAVTDLNGEPILPHNVRVVETQGGPVYLPEYVAPEEVIILLSETATELPLNIVVSRVNVQTQNVEDFTSLARALALIFPRVETYISMNGEIWHLFVGGYQVVYGFAESTVLLVLMVLNVGTMMLNVVYERRREVVTMSTVGLNPSHITAIFACEAIVMAFIAGSLGYLLGLTSCFFLSLLPSPPILRYKVEAFWSILALCFSISASVFGSIVPASKASIIATPSLLRRFIISSREKAPEGAWTLDVPVKIKEEDLIGFFDFMEQRLKVYNDPVRFEERVDEIVRARGIRGPSRQSISFVYKYAVNKIITENDLYSVRDTFSDEHVIRLASKSRLPWTIIGKEASARQTASFVRRLALEYTERERM